LWVGSWGKWLGMVGIKKLGVWKWGWGGVWICGDCGTGFKGVGFQLSAVSRGLKLTAFSN
jgi:ribosomal protein L37AE/L43A